MRGPILTVLLAKAPRVLTRVVVVIQDSTGWLHQPHGHLLQGSEAYTLPRGRDLAPRWKAAQAKPMAVFSCLASCP